MKKQDKLAELKMFDHERHDDFNLASDQSFEMLDAMILKFCPEINKKKLRILEVGCGTAAFGMRLVEKFINVEITGVDIAPAMIEWVNKKNIGRYTGVVGDAEDPALFQEHSFDVVVCPLVLHHFPDVGLVLKNVSKWIKNEGIVVIAEPNGSSPAVRLFNQGRRCVECICGKEYASRFATCNETTHSFATYKIFLEVNGFEILDRKVLGRFPRNKKGILGLSRILIHAVLDILPQPYCGEGIFIVASKHKVIKSRSRNADCPGYAGRRRS